MISIEFLRQFRIGEFAIFDLTVAFVGVLLLSPILSWLFRKVGLEIPKKSWLMWTIPIGIVAHLIVGRITPLTRDFLDLHGHYLAKVVIVGLFIVGLLFVRKTKKA